MHQEMEGAMKRLKKMGGLGKLAAMFGKGGMEGALGGLLPGAGGPPACPAFRAAPIPSCRRAVDKFGKK
jgi:hypothetical protein